MMLKSLNKKHLLIALFSSVAGLWIAADANAAVNGPYIGGQLGLGNVHQGGFSKPKITDDEPVVSFSNSSKDTGLAGRVFAGYQFNQNFATELGYSKFSNATAKFNAIFSEDPAASITANKTIKTDAVDLVAKGIIPLQNGFSVYGKAGIAYLRSSGSASATIKMSGEKITMKESLTQHHIYPTFGAGVGYDVTKNIIADVSWNHIQKTGSSSLLKNTDLFSVGLAYNFG